MDAAAFLHAARYDEQTRRATERRGGRPPAGAWGTAERHCACATGRTCRRRRLVPSAHAGGGGCLTGAPRFCSRAASTSWARLPALGSPAAGGWRCRRIRQPRRWTVPQLPSGVDGISFTVHPGQPRAVESATDGQDTPVSNSSKVRVPLDSRRGRYPLGAASIAGLRRQAATGWSARACVELHCRRLLPPQQRCVRRGCSRTPALGALIRAHRPCELRRNAMATGHCLLAHCRAAT